VGRQVIDRCFAEKYVKYYRQGRVRAIADVDTADIADCHRELLKSFDVRANLVMPVAYQDQLWGLLIAHHCRGPRPWQETEVALLGQLAVQAAIAIHQGELYKRLEVTNRELRKLSAQDRLTQLANRHRFDQKLQEEWLRLARSQSPLALLICDVDFFKRYNDTYGHLAGDRCLQRVANVLQAAAQRPGDLVARYGGEEFVIVMPETDLSGAGLLAERIQAALAKLAIPHGSSPLQQVTLSIGLASQIPQTATAPEALIKQADRELYRAKMAGRNQVKGNHS
jgi:diguanylate cyclase (GGDEF)-like protein